MGIYLNPDNMNFQKALNSEIYVDKSGLIGYTNKVMNSEQQNICVSRPRRFGKSMAANMLVAYYSRGCDSREMFQGLKISQDKSFEKHLNKYNVIHIDMQRFLSRTKKMTEMLGLLNDMIAEELEEEFYQIKFIRKDISFMFEKIFSQNASPLYLYHR